MIALATRPAKCHPNTLTPADAAFVRQASQEIVNARAELHKHYPQRYRSVSSHEIPALAEIINHSVKIAPKKQAPHRFKYRGVACRLIDRNTPEHGTHVLVQVETSAVNCIVLRLPCLPYQLESAHV